MPIIDAHTHIFVDTPDMADIMCRYNIRLINICYGGMDQKRLKLQEDTVERLFRKYGASLTFASTFDLTQRDAPDYIEQVTAWLDATFSAGALMTKIWKDVGMKITGIDGAYVLPDDPIFDPVYALLEKRGVPLMAHIADIEDVWKPLDPNHLFYPYFVECAEWHMYSKPDVPSHADLIAARDRIVAKHPKLTIIGAHLGSLSLDLDGLARRLDAFPNFLLDCSARTMILSRMQPQKVREFLMAYADRILYGTDLMTLEAASVSDNEILQYVTWNEAIYRAEYQYYAGTGTVSYWGEEVECLGLPRPVVENIFHGNALRVIPGLTA
jgi:predicted TIM-barrel fold metal-dependent hydrolase